LQAGVSRSGGTYGVDPYLLELDAEQDEREEHTLGERELLDARGSSAGGSSSDLAATLSALRRASDSRASFADGAAGPSPGRQAGRQTDRQAGRRTDGRSVGRTDGRLDRRTDGQAGRQTIKPADCHLAAVHLAWCGFPMGF
jgi:hypothetical protein